LLALVIAVVTYGLYQYHGGATLPSVEDLQTHAAHPKPPSAGSRATSEISTPTPDAARTSLWKGSPLMVAIIATGSSFHSHGGFDFSPSRLSGEFPGGGSIGASTITRRAPVFTPKNAPSGRA
jgi:hypothetical protein